MPLSRSRENEIRFCFFVNLKQATPLPGLGFLIPLIKCLTCQSPVRPSGKKKVLGARGCLQFPVPTVERSRRVLCHLQPHRRKRPWGVSSSGRRSWEGACGLLSTCMYLSILVSPAKSTCIPCIFPSSPKTTTHTYKANYGVRPSHESGHVYPAHP